MFQLKKPQNQCILIRVLNTLEGEGDCPKIVEEIPIHLFEKFTKESHFVQAVASHIRPIFIHIYSYMTASISIHYLIFGCGVNQIHHSQLMTYGKSFHKNTYWQCFLNYKSLWLWPCDLWFRKHCQLVILWKFSDKSLTDCDVFAKVLKYGHCPYFGEGGSHTG